MRRVAELATAKILPSGLNAIEGRIDSEELSSLCPRLNSLNLTPVCESQKVTRLFLSIDAKVLPSTPKAIVDKASQDIAQVLAAPDVKARFEPQGVELVSSQPDKFDAVIKGDAERYGKIIKPPAN